MGMFDRFRARPEPEWREPLLGSCRCETHVETMREVSIPYAAGAGRAGGCVVGDLLDRNALTVQVTGPADRSTRLPTGQRVGPLHWQVRLTDAGAALYDRDAPTQLDDCLSVQPGVDRVVALDPEGFAVGAADLCRSGVLAAMVTALGNPRVRRSREPEGSVHQRHQHDLEHLQEDQEHQDGQDDLADHPADAP
ncbi:MAG: hypothetical protein ACXVW2_17630 [Nocardioidaceae bacterium]